MGNLDANAQARGVSTRGAGNTQCGEYLEQRQKSQKGELDGVESLYSSWFMGFMDGYNFASTWSVPPKPQVTRELNSATIVALIDKHCLDNPLKDVFGSVAPVLRELNPRRTTH